MIPAPAPPNEDARLAALRRYDVLDTPAEGEFDDFTWLASQICGVPVALISLIDSQRQWFKSKVGTQVSETPREIALCTHTILQSDVLEVPNTLHDERFHDNPFVANEPHVRFYAGTPLTTPDGFNVGTLCVMDIVPRHLSDEQRESLARLGRRVVSQLELRLANKRLQLAEALRDDLTNMLVHDLRTPLTAFLGGLQSVEMLGELNTVQHESLEIATDGGETLLRMVNDLLDISKLESGAPQLDMQSLAAGALIERALRQVKPLMSVKQLNLVDNTAPDLPLFEADEDKLVRTLVNLLGNAIKFSRAAATITISAHFDAAAGAMVFAVRDTGEGIPPEALDTIFEKFGQVLTRQAGRTMSTGLGLTFCKMVVEAHQGRIRVESQPQQGSTFSFTVPVQKLGAS